MLIEPKQTIIENSRYFCKSTNVEIIILPFKVGESFSVKKPLITHLKYFVVYKFTCPGFKDSPIDEITHHNKDQKALRN